MGCLLSTPDVAGETRRRPKNIGEIVVFVPGLRIPMPLDFAQPLGDGLSKSLVERLSALRTRIVVMAGQEAPMTTKRRRTATQHGGSTLADLQQGLEDYLPVLLGLVENGNQLKHNLQFCWLSPFNCYSFIFKKLFIMQETTMSDSWYEVLSVLQLMAILSLSQANLLLLPNTSADGYQSKVSEECKRASIDIFLKAAGYLDFAVQQVLPQLPSELRKDLPLDLTEGVLKALCLQALGQGVEIQLGMAIDSIKATLAVKRRLACEMVKYWHQAQEHIMDLPLANGWGEKHKLFIRWKHVEAKAVAYYLHGLILEEGNAEKSAENAAAALHAAEEYLKESKKACDSFHMTPPASRNPPLWGASKYLSERIPKDVASKTFNWDSENHEMIMQLAPALPDFVLSLKPDDYQLPSMDPSWNDLQVQNLFPTK
ncbi:BRO1 domain - like 3 [Theobroma cacao]|nr:BRO1 domain - like 3 [Theobroma cacao]